MNQFKKFIFIVGIILGISPCKSQIPDEKEIFQKRFIECLPYAFKTEIDRYENYLINEKILSAKSAKAYRNMLDNLLKESPETDSLAQNTDFKFDLDVYVNCMMTAIYEPDSIKDMEHDLLNPEFSEDFQPYLFEDFVQEKNQEFLDNNEIVTFKDWLKVISSKASEEKLKYRFVQIQFLLLFYKIKQNTISLSQVINPKYIIPLHVSEDGNIYYEDRVIQTKNLLEIYSEKINAVKYKTMVCFSIIIDKKATMELVNDLKRALREIQIEYDFFQDHKLCLMIRLSND